MKKLLLAIAFLALGGSGASATNLIVNGDFSQEYAGFTSGYTKVPATDHSFYTTPPYYGVVSDAGAAFTNGYLSYGDHTTGDGLMLFFDGAGGGLDIWSQTVALAANATYSFSFWTGMPLGGDLSYASHTDLATKLNGASLGDTFITAQGSWQQISTTFTTGAAGNYTFAISDLQGYADGNDGLIDDIDLELVSPTTPVSPSVPEPASWGLMLLGVGAAGAALRRRGALRARVA